MNKKLQIFVSSTYTDLIEERQVAVESILDAGHIPAGMELFKAGKSQMKTIQKWIDESDVYVLIMGGRYGSIEEESKLSYTELEYRYALSKNIPIFAIILNDSFLYRKASDCNKDDIFEKDNIEKYNAFKKLVESKIVIYAKNIEHIRSIILSHLSSIITDEEYHLAGWVREGSSGLKSVDFKALSKVLSTVIVYINGETRINMNELFVQNIYFFNQGVEAFHYKNATLLVMNEILNVITDPKNQKKMLKISELGNKYYQYLILNEGYAPLKNYP